MEHTRNLKGRFTNGKRTQKVQVETMKRASRHPEPGQQKKRLQTGCILGPVLVFFSIRMVGHSFVNWEAKNVDKRPRAAAALAGARLPAADNQSPREEEEPRG
ncbi:hypothetical protein NDU88_006648 [Pleurodeles waltl]|uniref:Uncharacterized protein n=1 Tax=Pleurodeles waltl TaxID=8319 RepID=A0AAV7UMR6_PLEWA|nr:hypothetical protein NDU88_006648 [Pleurodeles waltl]